MINQTCKPKMALTIVLLIAMGFCNLVQSQTPTVSVRLANPSYSCETGLYCLDVEFLADTANVQLFGMNVRFFYPDDIMELSGFSDFQGGYGPVAPNPPTVVQSAPGFGTTFFGFPAPGVADWVNGAIQIVDGMQPAILLDTQNWTKLFQICFTVEGPIADSSNFCPPIVWDLELDPANGGYLAGDDGVVMTVVAPPPAMSAPANEAVVQYNWMYTGDGSAPPYGAPNPTSCISIICIPTIVTVQLDNPTYDCETGLYCLDVLFRANVPDISLFGMNVRFFYPDDIMELDGFTDFQGGYGPVSPDPPTVIQSAPGFGTTFFGFPPPGVTDFVNGAIQLVDGMAPPIILDTVIWTKLFQICFTLDGPIPDSSNFCPPVVWDLELNPANGGYLAGDDGVVMTIVAPPPAMSAPTIENVIQYNWMYTGDGSAPPYGAPDPTSCISLLCQPDIACPSDVTINCGDSADPAFTGSATATEECDSPITIVYSDVTTSDPQQCVLEYQITRTWIAFNECGLADTCIQLIYVADTLGPVINCPADITIECDESTDPSNTGMASATDACDPSPEVSFIDIIVAGSCPQEYTIDRIWTATDTCGNVNIALCRQEITIVDDTPPAITCPVDLTLECTDSIPTANATATDNCSSNITLDYTDVLCDNPVMGFTGPYDFANWTIITPSGGSVVPMGDMEVMLGSPDGNVPCPNGASVLFQIVIPSTGQIVFDWNYTSYDIDGPLFDPFGYRLNGIFYQLTDDNGGLVQSGVASVAVTAGDIFAFEQNSIDCILGEGATTVVEFFACIDQVADICTQLIIRDHTATDECGNQSNCVQTIFIEDTTPPVITCAAQTTPISCPAVPVFTPPTVTDACDATVTVTFADATTPGSCAGTYSVTRTWTASDNCGNTSTCSVTIVVQDITPPTITCVAQTTPINCPAVPVFIPPTATDACDATVAITFTDVTTPGSCVGTYSVTRTWTATDDCGNTATCSGTIVVQDITPPTITCVAQTSPINCPAVPVFIPPTATDACDATVAIAFADVTTPGSCVGTYSVTRTWTATDDCGNTATCSGTIVVQDITPPTITCVAQTTPINCPAVPVFTPPTATDACDPTVTITFTDATTQGTCAGTYSVTRTWTATDDCGNTATCSRTIVVQDITPPTITCVPQTTPINCPAVPVFTPPTATDACDATVEITFTDATTPGSCAGTYSVTRTWTATDDCGNTATCSGTIVVQDITPPTITCVAQTTPIDCPAVPVFLPPTATDACDATVTITFTDVTTPGSCVGTYSVTRTWTATDDCGNTATCSGTIVVQDITPPTITCVAQTTPIDCPAVPVFLPPTATDACDATVTITFTDVTTPGSCIGTYSVTRTWTATDDCNNTATCSGTIVVQDITPPTITCVAQTSPIDCPAVPVFLPPTATDACDATVTITFTDVTTPGSCVGTYSVTRTWTAIDDCGNTATCSGTIVVQDITPPTITCVAQTSPIDCPAVPVFNPPTATDACDPTVAITFTDATTPGSCAGTYTVTRTWTATDDCGNTAACSGTIVVQDITPPTITCVAQTSPIDCPAVPVFTPPTATDACDASVTVTFIDVSTPGTCAGTYTTVRTWTAVDDCGNSVTCSNTIVVQDITPPTLICAVDITVECGDSTDPAATGTATATDSCDPEPAVDYSDDISQSESCPGDYTIFRTWTVVDACGNGTNCLQIISVSDNTPPTITCAVQTTPIDCPAVPVFLPATATDACDASVDITFNDVTTQGSCAGTYSVTRTWTATDDCFNSSTCSSTIVVQDVTPPTITCATQVTPIQCPAVPVFNPASATDACDVSVAITFADVTTPGSCPANYSVTRTWTATDDCGNTSTCSATVVVQDIIPPFVMCPPGVTVSCASEVPAILTGGVTVSDNCSTITVTHDGDVITNQTCVNRFTLTRTYRATDACGNSATCAQVIIVDDQIPPTITCPAPVTVSCASQVPAVNTSSVTASDNCAGGVTITHVGDVITNQTCVNRFTLTRTYRATDACGNSATCTQVITVNDVTPPTITCPAPVTVMCASQVPAVNVNSVTASDNCTGGVTVTHVGDVITNQTCANRFTLTRTYLATDVCGNTASCTQVITVFDNTPPVITCPPNITILYGADENPANTGSPTGTDNCGGTPVFTFTNNIIPGICVTEYTINRTWTATDACGNTATCLQVIFVDGQCIVDLNLTKVLIDAGPVEGGDNVDFVITVMNEGEVSAGSITITDYIPIGFTLNDPDWIPGNQGSTGQSASKVLSIANGLLDANGLNPGESVVVLITLRANDDIAPGVYVNVAEISFVFDVNGVDITTQDIDSDPDQNDVNDPPGEDDIDQAQICVLPHTAIAGDGYVCPGETSVYSVVDYNPNFTYVWTLSGGGVIVDDNGSDITVDWQDAPGGPFQITLTIILGGNCQTTLYFFVYIQGVDALTCNDHIQISVNENCEAVVLSGMILEGEVEGNNNYYVILTDEDGNVIPNATLTSEHIGQCFTAMVVNECNGQSCWGTICVEDKIPPVIECADVTVSCGSSLEPVFEPPVTGSAVASVNPGAAIGPNQGQITLTDLVLDLPSNAVITDVNVTVDLVHTWSGDLDVVLISPEGTEVVLASSVCGSADNWDDVTFDDQAGILVTNACNNNPPPALLSGSVIPQGSLGVLNGQSPLGTWTLRITDLANADAGTLNLFALNVAYYLSAPNAPIASDACGELELTYTDSYEGEDCEDVILTRTWTATDGSGNTATCNQIITIIPLTLENITFPEAYVGVCGESILPDHTGWPTVDGQPITDENNICNIFVGYWDKELNECGGGRKIVRTWTILDWCTVEVVEAVQVIKLQDTEGPVLTCPQDYEVGTDFWYCYANVSVPKPGATDECSEVASYSLTSSSGTVISFGNNYVINGLEPGTHTVTWTVADECGNETTCSFEITVVDDVVPVANCDQHTIVALTNDGPQGITLVPATVFDDGSYDNCGPVTFRARRMDSCIDFDWTTEGACIDDTPGGIPPVNSRDRGTVHRPCVPFSCCDVGAGPVMVELEVTDAAGNVNYCMIEATVQDKISPFVECPPDIIVSCDFWFNVQEDTFVDGEGNNNGSLDEDPLSAVFGNMYDAFRYDESIRQNIIINDPSNDDYHPQPYNWGLDGWADDNCEVNLQVRVRVIDDCSGGDLPGNAPDGAVKLIERRFSASDGNDGVAPGTCTQRIWVVDFDPFYITDNTCNNSNPQDGVIWPCDVLLTTCPEDLGNLGQPTIFDDACSLIGVTYEDTRFDFVDGACYKILREWAVIDWCQYNSQTGEGLWHYTQVIKVHDEDGPEFVEPCETVTLCVADDGVSLPDNNQAFLGEDNPLSSSCSVHLNLSRVVHETCSDIVKYDVKIYPFNGTDYILIKPTTSVAVDSATNDAVLSFDTRQSTIQAIRLNGIPYNSQWCGDYHRILWSVEDGCGNWSHCEYLFRLEDCKQPSPVCINGLSTVVMPVGGQVTVWAKDFNASSFDDCTPEADLLYSFDGDTYTPSYTYTCENVPAFNVEIATQIWVADGGTDDNCNSKIEWSERNKDYCTTTIVITDNAGVCDTSGPIAGSTLGGEILTEHTAAISNVNVTLTSPGHFFPQYITSQDGHFEFNNVPLGNDYTIATERNDEHKNGVSTLDLVRIQKHLLGKELFTSPYQYIAADANNSENVSAIDLIEIRKLILGIYTEFPLNTSWRFVQEGYQMNPESPWPFNEIIQIPDLAIDSMMHNDFVGVKVGDVNNTAKANANQILPRNGRRVLHVALEGVSKVKAGDVVEVRLSIPESVEGFQWTLETEGLTYDGVSSETMNFNDSHIGLLKDGVITMSWNVEGEQAVLPGQVVTMRFIASATGNLEDMIHLTSGVTEAEAYTPEGEILDVKLGHTETGAEFALYQNNPNPWNMNTTIGFDLPVDAAVKLTVFDVTGKAVKLIEGDFKAGYNTITLTVSDLPSTGVMYYRLDSGEYSASKKMVLIK